MHVCIGNRESHLPQQLFPGEVGSQCTMIRNMICACAERCCTWLICCTTCLCEDSFVWFCCIVRCWIVEASWGASAPMQDRRMVFESAGALFAHHSLTYCSTFNSMKIPFWHFSHVTFCLRSYFMKRKLQKNIESCIYCLPILKSQRQSNYNWLIIFPEPNTPFNTVIWKLLKWLLWALLRIHIMAKPLTATKSSHRSCCERILPSCDCAMRCGEEGRGMKLHCAICNRPKMYSPDTVQFNMKDHERFRVCYTLVKIIFYLFSSFWFGFFLTVFCFLFFFESVIKL